MEQTIQKIKTIIKEIEDEIEVLHQTTDAKVEAIESVLNKLNIHLKKLEDQKNV